MKVLRDLKEDNFLTSRILYGIFYEPSIDLHAWGILNQNGPRRRGLLSPHFRKNKETESKWTLTRKQLIPSKDSRHTDPWNSAHSNHTIVGTCLQLQRIDFSHTKTSNHETESYTVAYGLSKGLLNWCLNSHDNPMLVSFCQLNTNCSHLRSGNLSWGTSVSRLVCGPDSVAFLWLLTNKRGLSLLRMVLSLGK